MTTIRSFSGISADRALSSDVLPLPVPPAMTIFLCSSTARPRNSLASSDMLPDFTSESRLNVDFLNLRIEMQQPFRELGGTMTCTREPSGRRASMLWLSSSIERPVYSAMLRAAAISRPGWETASSDRFSLPSRSK